MEKKNTDRNLENKNIVISVDPGFDSTKIVINGEMFCIPYNVVDITGKEKDAIGAKKAGYILSHYIDGKSFLVGDEARKRMMEEDARINQASKQTMESSFEKFTTDDFEVNIMTCIGVALVRYSEMLRSSNKGMTFDIQQYSLFAAKSDERNKAYDSYYEGFNFWVGVALPHDAVEDVWSTVKKKIAQFHNFSIELADGTYDICIDIKRNHCATQSQARAAFLGLLSDDNGIPLDGPEAMEEKNIPALLIDGGYRTVGMFKISRDGAVVQAESNTTYAMFNINTDVEETLVKNYGIDHVKEYNIEEWIKEGGVVNYLKNDRSEQVDLTKIRDEKIKEVCDNLIAYLNQKYNNLLDIKTIIITGGTGKVYFDQISKYIKEYRNSISVRITDYEFEGKEISPAFGVATGLYKVLNYLVREAQGE
ncbi:hypothetical protein SAMN06296386_10935 [Lachnospiraceae bacterium]|nr:hypothetical protein SAMN06296386_10935 [Lachnospiraceae bacterium]